MADSLVLSGVRQVTKHSGQEMTRLDNPRGGNTWQIKRWWVKSKTAVYTPCSVFKVDAQGTSCFLAVEAKSHINLRIDHDGVFNFTFSGINEVERVALFTNNWEIIEHYVFPKLSGGRIMTVVPAGAASKPSELPAATSIGNLTFSSSEASITEGETVTFTVANDGDASGLTYLWSVASGTGTIQGSATGSSVSIQADAAGSLSATCAVSSSDPGVVASPVSGTSDAVTVIASFATRVANADLTYTVTVVDIAAEGDPEELVYALNGTNQQAVALDVGESVAFDFSGVASNHPLGIFTDSTKTTPVTVGVETGGTGNATLLFTPPIAGTFSYQCINHADMGGDITVSE